MPKNSVLALLLVAATGLCAQLPSVTDDTPKALASSTPEVPVSPTTPADVVSIACQTDSMLLTITPARPDPPDSHNHIGDDVFEQFNGIVYPAGLGTNSSCLREYRNQRGDLQYSLPLRSCNTMFTDNDDGTIEFFNNVVVQPHLTLVTGQGRGYQVRCRYQRRDLIQYHHLDAITPQRLRGNALDSDDDIEDDDETFPSCNMKIYKGDPENKQVAMNAKIGEDLTLVVSLEKQDKFGLLVSECNVRDGIGWAEQSLIADDGCPLDGEIMGMFQYSADKQEARVSFQAHKFPYTASVYYTCEVKLCDLNHPTDCEPCSHKRRTRRQAEVPAMVKVYSGLYVNDADNPELGEVVKTKNEDEICISQRNFAIGICIAGVILMIAVIAAIACILARRRNPKTYSRTGSSLYSGPYTNTGYSHTS